MRVSAPPRRAEEIDALYLSDGLILAVRPIEGDDADRLLALFCRLSPESRYARFLSPKLTLEPRELAYFMDIDHVRHEALAAVDERDGSFVAVARYIEQPDQPGVAEMAIEVADEFQRLGVGTALAARILRRARANGLTVLVATTLRENRAARALLRRLRFHPTSSSGREIQLELTSRCGGSMG